MYIYMIIYVYDYMYIYIYIYTYTFSDTVWPHNSVSWFLKLMNTYIIVIGVINQLSFCFGPHIECI